MQQKKKLLQKIGLACLVLLGAGCLGLGGIFVWFVMQMFKPLEMNGSTAIAQVTSATYASLAETQAAVSEANFLSEGGGIDGTAFYQFRATNPYIQKFLTRTNLKVLPSNSYQCQSLIDRDLWRSWWNPKNYPSARCYTGLYDGANYYLLYDTDNQIVFLKITGT